MPDRDAEDVLVEPQEDDKKEVVIDLDAPVDDGKKDDPKPLTQADVEAAVETSLRPLRNQTESLRRQNERLQKELDAARAKPVVDEAGDKAVDAWAKIQDGHQWKERIAQLADERFEARLQQHQQQQAQQAEVAQRLVALSAAKAKVIALYPELSPDEGDEGSKISQAYQQVLNEDPTLLKDPHGPETAMYRMEAALRAQGVAPRSWGTPEAPAADPTRVRARDAGGLPPPRSGAGGNKITLSVEERDLCDMNGIKYADYANAKHSLSIAGGLEA